MFWLRNKKIKFLLHNLNLSPVYCVSVKALYEKSHPEYLQYIYLVAPISLVLLNPIGFTMLEINKHKQDSTHPTRKVKVVLRVVKDVLVNPIIFMAVIGIAGNFLFKQNVPAVIDDILEVLGMSRFFLVLCNFDL